MVGAAASNLRRALLTNPANPAHPALLRLTASLRLFFDPRGYSKMAGEPLDNRSGSGSSKPVTRVLFCGLQFPASHNYTIEYLQKFPFIQVDVVPLEKVPQVIHHYHLCVVKMCRFDSALIAKASQMKLLMQFGVGLEGVDIHAATENKIKVARIPGSTTGNSVSCAEMSIYLMLGLLRRQKEMEIAVKQRALGEPTGETLFGKTVFILGFGAIGIDLAKRLRPFGVKILATKRKWPSDDSCCSNDEIGGLVDKKGTPENMYEFAGEADIVVACLSLNKETAGVVDAKFVSSMKKGSLLVNIARGGILDYNAVYQHLETGHLGGLGIDVAWFEPFDPDDPILKLPNVLITPHVGGVTECSYRAMAKVVGDCALQLHEGKPFTVIEFVN
ncbi:D-3-phosphoglycerate dehydrogenase [Rhynchospora pubera]|uniref:D-3-phosphoglycerate dehydrogenase n=1 Tax=Rhynchospora pubera TaxID=906938 RepID=A0AAV8CR20_9POAL|nr:D-3-phosphoglycerate dehydrogenase [Rhynchospora pubera]